MATRPKWIVGLGRSRSESQP